MTASTLQLGGSHGPAIVVTATSAVNGLAFDSHQTWAFWRADGSALVETPFRLRTGERATMAVVRSLDPRLHGWPRLAILVEAALMHLRAPLSRTRMGVGKLLTSAAVEIKAGTDVNVGATGALAINTGGELKSKCGGDFGISGRSVTFTLASSLDVSAGGSVKASPGSITLKGGSVGGKGAKVVLKGEVHYK